MHDEQIYELTARGRAELHGSGTTLTTQEIALLVRFDGALTLRQVQAGLSAAGRKSFETLLRTLLARGLLAPVELDPFASRFQADLDALSAVVGDRDADAALGSLRRTGFFVQIARPRADVPARAPGNHPTVLVIEDEPALARFVESYLNLCGFRVRVASDRAGVVQALRQAPLPDLVLLDVMLPDADGFDILLRLRQHPALRHLAVVMLTGKATRAAVIKGMAAGADGYITKPFEPDALLRAVRTVLGLAEDVRDARQDTWTNPDAKLQRVTGAALRGDEH